MSDPVLNSAVEYYRALLAPVFAKRRFVLLGTAITSLVGLARELRGLGADPSFLLGSVPGVGERPDPAEFPSHSLDLVGRDQIDAAWRYEAALAGLPEAARARIDHWDPERRAHAAGLILLSDVASVAGRARYARRRPEWAALEDKTRVHAFFDSIGVLRGPLAVVRAERECLLAAHARLDRGEGTVWAGDITPGVHGGSTFVRRVFSRESASAAAEFFAGQCKRVRIAPFVEGIPCSVHGLVFLEGVAVFRPVELITLREPASSRFVYAGTASFWDPPDCAREALRALARRVGFGLREQVGYRGAFTLDGVLGEAGFVPTEINPRVGAGLQHLQHACKDLPLAALALAAQHDEPLRFEPERLEAAVLHAADAVRSGSGRLHVSRAFRETSEHGVVFARGRDRLARDGERAGGRLLRGPSQAGGFVAFLPEPDLLERGASFAPNVARALALADEVFGTEIGRLEPARPAYSGC